MTRHFQRKDPFGGKETSKSTNPLNSRMLSSDLDPSLAMLSLQTLLWVGIAVFNLESLSRILFSGIKLRSMPEAQFVNQLLPTKMNFPCSSEFEQYYPPKHKYLPPLI